MMAKEEKKPLIPPELKFKHIDNDYALYVNCLTHNGDIYFIGELPQFYIMCKSVFGRLPQKDETKKRVKFAQVGSTRLVYDPYIKRDEVKVAIIDTKCYNKSVCANRLADIERVYLI